MKARVVTIPVEGETVVVGEYDDPSDLSEKILQNIVDGDIDLIPGFRRYENRMCKAFQSDTAEIDRLPYNVTATIAWILADKGKPPGTVLRGNIVVVTGDEEFLEQI